MVTCRENRDAQSGRRIASEVDHHFIPVLAENCSNVTPIPIVGPLNLEPIALII